MGRPGFEESSVKNRQATNGFARTDSYHIMDIEIDRGLDGCNSSLCSVRENEIQLHKYHEIPEFLQGNPYVVQGYRAFLPFSLCLKSLFVWTNETLNIWTHLGGFFLFMFLMLFDNFIVLPKYAATYSDYIIISLGLLCFQFCMLCSTGFHMFACHSERASKRWLAVDLAGISIGVIGCYLPAVHYAFYCLSIWRDLYLIIICLLSVATLVAQLHPRYSTSTFVHHRVLIYSSLVAYGIIPTAHWVYLNGGWSSELVRMFVPKVTVMYMLGLLALGFYSSKFPERFFPGTFDYIGSSHQLWHIVVVVAFTWWHAAGKEILLYQTTHECVV
ncbi:hypothetical protein ScPMuIL_004229 [Solemya velum]